MTNATLEVLAAMELAEYIERCRDIAGARWDEFAARYCFAAAHEDGLTPDQAVSDCLEWLSEAAQ